MSMKTTQRVAAATVAFATLLIPFTALAEIDFAANDIFLTWEETSFRIHAEVSVQSAAETGEYTTEITCYVDGAYAFSHPVVCNVVVQPDCEDSPDCTAECPPIIINYEIAYGSCAAFLEDGYGCLYPYVDSSALYPYTGQTQCTVVVDEADVHAETDEDNNTCSIEIGAVPVEPLTWALIKTIYRVE